MSYSSGVKFAFSTPKPLEANFHRAKPHHPLQFYKELTKTQQEIVLEALVQIPGRIVKLRTLVEDNEDLCSHLSFHDIERLLEGEKFTLFEELTKSYDTLMEQREAVGVYYTAKSKELDGIVKMHFRNLVSFVQYLETFRMFLINKMETHDASLRYIVECFTEKENEKDDNSPASVVFYCNLLDDVFRERMEKLKDIDIFGKIMALYGAPMSQFEEMLLRQQFMKGRILFVMDNIEYIRENNLRYQIVQLCMEIKESMEHFKIPQSRQLIATHKDNTRLRKTQLECPAKTFVPAELKDFSSFEDFDQFVSEGNDRESMVLTLETFFS